MPPRRLMRADQGPLNVHPVKMSQEVEVKESAAEFAVSDAANAVLKLFADNGGDMSVFEGPEGGGVVTVWGQGSSCFKNLLWSEEGADVVGAVDASAEGHSVGRTLFSE